MMIKNKKLFTVLICLGAAAALTVIFFAGIFISGNNIATVRCYVAENDAVYMVYHGRLVKLSGAKNVGLSTGDEALVIFGTAFAESYPEQTRTLYIVKLSDGSPDELELDEGHREQYERLGFVFE